MFELQGHTLTCRTTLVRPDNWMRTAGHGAGNEHTHLSTRVAVAVATAIMPAVTFLISVPVGGEAIVRHWGRGSGAWDMAAFWRHKHESTDITEVAKNLWNTCAKIQKATYYSLLWPCKSTVEISLSTFKIYSKRSSLGPVSLETKVRAKWLWFHILEHLPVKNI